MTPTARRRRSELSVLGLDRFGIFVPAIMGASAAFWLTTVLADMVRWRREEALARRAVVAGRGASRLASGVTEPPESSHMGLRHRGAYLIIGAALLGVAAYVFFGSYFNYRRDGGYLEHMGLALATACVIAGVASVIGLASLATWLRWPWPPRWARAVDRATPLSRAPLDLLGPGQRPDWRLTATALLVPNAGIVVMFLVARNWRAVVWFDERIADAISAVGWIGALGIADPVGSTTVAVVAMTFVLVASLRCRPLLLAYPVALGGALVVDAFTDSVVERTARETVAAGRLDSFPSTNVMLATLLAGIVPLGVASILGSGRWTTPLRIVLGLGAAGSAVSRVHDGRDLPSDVVGGALLGLTFVLAVQWVIDHEEWHEHCRGCTWSPQSQGPPLTGIVPLHVSVAKATRALAHVWAAAAVVTLTALTLTVGIPRSEDGVGFGLEVQEPAQLTLAAIVSLGALISWRWDATGAVLIALGGAGLGVFGAIQYPPAATIALTAMLVAPAVLLWLGWQHRRTIGQILALAGITSVLLLGTWAGASEVHDYWFGPTHEESATVLPPSDLVAWAWLGGLTHDGVTVTAGLVDDDSEAVLVVRPADGGSPLRSEPVTPGPAPAARMRIDGLRPDTEYRYAVEVDGELDTARGVGRFRTAPLGPGSFTVAVGACARTGSNGAVFDAIRHVEPLVFVNLGDMHYSDLASDDPADHREAMTRVLTSPAPAALARDVPTAYVWDDHDYGPNDGDASSPSRSAVQRSYRELVPHYDLPDDEAVYQAFTLGRVRFVLTDHRSERTDGTMLGDEQLSWLIDELTVSSRTHAVVVWGSTVPWVGEADPEGDSWAGYSEERRVVADALADAGVANLVMIAGDSHMVAIDDGTHTDYSSDGSGGFPLLHAAALDRRGSVKGGPYSEGTFPGGGRFGTVTVIDDGHDVTVTLAGITWEGEVLIERSFAFEGTPGR